MDSNWAHVAGEVLGGALLVVTGLNRRKAQNKKMNHTMESILTREVGRVRDQVDHLTATIDILRVDLRAVIERELSVIRRIDQLEVSLPKVEMVVSQAMNFLERAKAKALEAVPVQGSGGKVAIKKKE